MRIPDELRDSVCFLKTTRAGNATGMSTAFFVGSAIGAKDRFKDLHAIYLVTAKHCLFDESGVPDEISVLLNTIGGGFEEVTLDRSQWITHESSDVAIFPWVPDVSRYKYAVYPTASVATHDVVKARAIGPGDEVFVSGLLIHHPGETQIMPIVRQGAIAALPKDPIGLRIGDYPGAQETSDTVALLEVRSIGGLSGSPVFLHLPFWRDMAKGDLFVGGGESASSGGEHWLLGVMHGFYPVGRNDPDNVSGGNENLNTGIAVVTLVDRAMDLINSPEQMNARADLKDRLDKAAMPTPSSGVPIPPTLRDRANGQTA
jgi:hypothetical protein